MRTWRLTVCRCDEVESQSDYVDFSNFNIDLMDRKMSRLCGSKEDLAKKEVSSDSNFFRVTFKSNDAFDSTGFEAFYQFRRVEGSPNKICCFRIEYNWFGIIATFPDVEPSLLNVLSAFQFPLSGTLILLKSISSPSLPSFSALHARGSPSLLIFRGRAIGTSFGWGWKIRPIDSNIVIKVCVTVSLYVV